MSITCLLVLTALRVAQAPLHAQLTTITNQPASQAVWAGAQATFTVGVSGTGPFTYQWQFNGTNLPNGAITTVAGGGNGGDGGAATNASLQSPNGVAVDANGNVFIADSGNNRIRKVSTNGIITTVAGNGVGSSSGDGGPATGTSLADPFSAAVDSSGNLFIADTYNYRVREVSANGLISTVAGIGVLGHSLDGGLATNTAIGLPAGLALDAAGNVFFADFFNNWVWRVNTNGVILRVAGSYNYYGYSGDGGPATNANLSFPEGLAVDANGNVFFADVGNNRIREVFPIQGPILVLNNVTAGDVGTYQLVVTGSSGSAGSVASGVSTLVVTASPLIYGTARYPDGSVSLNFVSRPSSTNGVLCATNLAGTDGDRYFTGTNTASYQTRFYWSLFY